MGLFVDRSEQSTLASHGYMYDFSLAIEKFLLVVNTQANPRHQDQIKDFSRQNHKKLLEALSEEEIEDIVTELARELVGAELDWGAAADIKLHLHVLYVILHRMRVRRSIPANHQHYWEEEAPGLVRSACLWSRTLANCLGLPRREYD